MVHILSCNKTATMCLYRGGTCSIFGLVTGCPERVFSWFSSNLHNS